MSDLDVAESLREELECSASDRCAEDHTCPNHKTLERAADRARKNERTKIIDWLQRRCEYVPPCGHCAYCRIAATLALPTWDK